MTRTIFVQKFRFAFRYFVGYILVHQFTCTQYSRHSLRSLCYWHY